GAHPNGLAFSADGKTLFVANWGGDTVDAIDVASRSLERAIAVGDHPEALVLSRDGRSLYASESDDDAVGTIDVVSERRVADLDVGPYGGRLFGASPSALALSPDGTRLYVACAAANALAVLDLRGASARLLGAIPVGWYPTAVVAPNGDALIVADGMGEGPHANPAFRPFARPPVRRGYVATAALGSLRRIAVPNDDQAAAGLSEVRALAGPNLAAAMSGGPVAQRATVVRAHGPIRHVIYIIKENRTYDQVLGDLSGADGDPQLVLFGARVTPNEHALARRFGILDDTFADAEVSADGHLWSDAAFANDYAERMWPPVYGGRRDLYDFGDGGAAARPHNGFLWDDALAHGIGLRNYGEFTSEAATDPPAIFSHDPELAPVTDPRYPGFDLDYSDLDREREWAREFAAYVRGRDLPQLEIVWLPNDHTAGTAPGRLAPTAYVAQNDLALGRLIATVSHSPYWPSSALFVLEDDAQDGPDHVSDRRITAYLVSPYAAGGVLHEHYSTAGILHTIELLLGLPPLSAYDAAARPLYAAFKRSADLRPYDALPESVDLNATNSWSTTGAAASARQNFNEEDAVAPALLNTILWHAIRGPKSTPPPYGAFVTTAATR
ncbi:MAG: bifunctional YncE family protein/alkaline phosphatase family protein, partial [Vulcanimicrobiaceae bacterium]